MSPEEYLVSLVESPEKSTDKPNKCLTGFNAKQTGGDIQFRLFGVQFDTIPDRTLFPCDVIIYTNPNNAPMKNRKDLNLGKFIYVFITSILKSLVILAM